MSNEKVSPARAMAALFEGLGRREQMALLGKLEIAGGSIYRALAADEKNAKAREALLKAAEDEERNRERRRGNQTEVGDDPRRHPLS